MYVGVNVFLKKTQNSDIIKKKNERGDCAYAYDGKNSEKDEERDTVNKNGENDIDSESVDGPQAPKEAERVQGRVAKTDVADRYIHSEGKTGIERRTLQNVHGEEKFKELAKIISSEIAIKVSNQLVAKYYNDNRVDKYDIIEVITYAVLLDENNE